MSRVHATVAASGGDMTGAAVTAALAVNNFEIATATMGADGSGDIHIMTATGAVEADQSDAGGLIAYVNQSAVSQSFATGDVTVLDSHGNYAGGLLAGVWRLLQNRAVTLRKASGMPRDRVDGWASA